MERRRVVVTGMGVVSPVGIGVDAFWNALLAGKSGVTPITEFDATDFPVKIAGEVKDFDPVKYVGDKKTVRHMDRNAQFAVAAAKMAIEDAKLDMSAEDPNRVGTIIGTGIGGIKTRRPCLRSSSGLRMDSPFPGRVFRCVPRYLPWS